MSEHFEHPVLDEFYQRLTEVEHIEQELQQAKERLKESVLDLPHHIGENKELQDQVIGHLYWFESHVTPNMIIEAFNLNRKSVARVAGGVGLTINCRECSEPYQDIARSLHELRTKIHDKYSTCPACKVRREETHQQHIQRREQQAQRLYELRTMPYREYLKTPEWQETRIKHLKRAKFSCQVCNAYGVQLNVHHRTYERRGCEQVADLLVLCQHCHEIFHTNGKLAKQN